MLLVGHDRCKTTDKSHHGMRPRAGVLLFRGELLERPVASWVSEGVEAVCVVIHANDQALQQQCN